MTLNVEDNEKDEEQNIPEDRFKPNHSEYSWLYQDGLKETDEKKEKKDYELSFEEDDDKKKLRSLIDEVID